MADVTRRYEVKEHTREGEGNRGKFLLGNTKRETLPSYAEKAIREAGGILDHIKITSTGNEKFNLYDTKNKVETSFDLKTMKQNDPALYKGIEYNVRKQAVIESIAAIHDIKDIQRLNDL